MLVQKLKVSPQKILQQFDIATTSKHLIIFLLINFYWFYKSIDDNKLERRKLVFHHS